MKLNWKCLGGGGWGLRSKKILKQSMKLNWKFLRGGEMLNKKPVGGVRIFSGTVHYTQYLSHRNVHHNQRDTHSDVFQECWSSFLADKVYLNRNPSC